MATCQAVLFLLFTASEFVRIASKYCKQKNKCSFILVLLPGNGIAFTVVCLIHSVFYLSTLYCSIYIEDGYSLLFVKY
jgi:hypothetical protein